MSPEELAGKVVVGKLLQIESRGELCDEVYALMSGDREGLSAAETLVS
jgi:hypothetical protein